MNLPDQTRQALLADWPVARLGTVSAGGHPHSVPIVFCEFNGALFAPIDGKQKRSGQLKRFENLAVNARATLLLDEYDADWQSLWWVRLDGIADRFEPGTAAGEAIAERLLEQKLAESDV